MWRLRSGPDDRGARVYVLTAAEIYLSCTVSNVAVGPTRPLSSGYTAGGPWHCSIDLHLKSTRNAWISTFTPPHIFSAGPGSSVGIATDYGLDGPGSNPGGDEIFRPSRLALGPTQPPVKWVPGLFRGKVRPGRAADHSPPSSAAV